MISGSSDMVAPSGGEKQQLEKLLQKIASIAELVETVCQDEDARKTTHAALSKVTLSLESPVDIVNLVQFSPSVFMATRIAIDLRLFNVIVEKQGPIGSKELGNVVGAEENLLVRLLRGLTVAGLVSEVGECIYEANATTKRFCLPAVQAGVKHWYDVGLKVNHSMPEYLRKNGYTTPADATSGPLQYAFNTKLDSYTYWTTQPATYENFNIYMSGKYDSAAPKWSWVDYYPVQQNVIDGFDENIGNALLVDVGGGFGQVCQNFINKFPSAPGEVIVQDLPEVIDGIKTLDSRIERLKYSLFTPQPVHGARAFYFANVFHNWSDTDCRKILANTIPAMKKGYSKLLINDGIVPATNCGLSMVGRDLGMMIFHSATERSLLNWGQLLTPFGLQITGVWHSNRGEGVIEAMLGA